MLIPFRRFADAKGHSRRYFHSSTQWFDTFSREESRRLTRDGDAEGVSRHGRRADRLTVVHRTPRGASLDRTGDPAPRRDPMGPRDCSTSRTPKFPRASS